ncbi:hypothetical protein OROGR_005488 [Orobanche gracilis]
MASKLSNPLSTKLLVIKSSGIISNLKSIPFLVTKAGKLFARFMDLFMKQYASRFS